MEQLGIVDTHPSNHLVGVFGEHRRSARRSGSKNRALYFWMQWGQFHSANRFRPSGSDRLPVDQIGVPCGGVVAGSLASQGPWSPGNVNWLLTMPSDDEAVPTHERLDEDDRARMYKVTRIDYGSRLS